MRRIQRPAQMKGNKIYNYLPSFHLQLHCLMISESKPGPSQWLWDYTKYYTGSCIHPQHLHPQCLNQDSQQWHKIYMGEGQERNRKGMCMWFTAIISPPKGDIWIWSTKWNIVQNYQNSKLLIIYFHCKVHPLLLWIYSVWIWNHSHFC